MGANRDMALERWQSEIDRQLEKMMDEGGFKNLPGEGKPLNLGDETYVPDEMRMAYRILAQNDMAPDWILMGKDVEQSAQKLRSSIATHLRIYRDALAHAEKSGSVAYRQNADGVWESAKRSLAVLVKEHNNMVLSFNLKVPKGIAHQAMFDLDKEIAKQK
jgi:hypothetical protein